MAETSPLVACVFQRGFSMFLFSARMEQVYLLLASSQRLISRGIFLLLFIVAFLFGSIGRPVFTPDDLLDIPWAGQTCPHPPPAQYTHAFVLSRKRLIKVHSAPRTTRRFLGVGIRLNKWQLPFVYSRAVHGSGQCSRVGSDGAF